MKQELKEHLNWALEHIPPWDEFWLKVPPSYLKDLNSEPTVSPETKQINKLLGMFPNSDTKFNIKKDRYVDEYRTGNRVSKYIGQPDYADIRETFNYNEITGILTWKSNGEVAGYPGSSDYLLVEFHGSTRSVQRIIWCYVNIEYPIHSILHLNGNRADNRISNLLDIPYSEHHKYMDESDPKETPH